MPDKPDDNAGKGNTDKTQGQEGAAAAEAARQAAAAAEAANKGGDGKSANADKSEGTQGKEETSLLGEEGEGSTETEKEEGKEKGKDGEKKDEGKKDEKAVPEKYEFKVPEGLAIDDQALELATPIFKKHGLTQEGAQEFVDLSVAIQKEAAIKSEMAFLTQRKAWREEIKKDPQYKSTLSSAKKFMLAIGGIELVQMVEKSWMGDHPLLIKSFAKGYRQIADDRFVEGGGGKTPKSIEERMYPNHGK